ncbi:hypothetical protein ACN20G_31760 (plasmid) [Streptomyces sp. BI20]|uniref:hypothetical protein n=1 Tax=Streptomyces sp. BI20 TaxID=3403460 RepID=UPI003C7783AE
MTVLAPPHPLLSVFLDAARGVFPPVDGGVTVVPATDDGLECVVAFTGHAYVATSLPADEVRAAGADGFGGAHSPEFLTALGGPKARFDVLDVTLVAFGAGGPARLPQAGPRGLAHPRVIRARGLRTDVRAYEDERGVITVARGVAGRRELSVERWAAESESNPGEGTTRGPGASAGAGRGLISDALTLVPAGEPVFAAVSPGNARSLRAFLASGFVPVGSEILLHPGRARP